jgi:hypothetical protein
MGEPRWPWLLTAALMLTSAVAAAWSTYLYWLPCRGSMLDGTLIKPIRDDGGTYEEFERLDPAVKARMFACEARMDGDVAGLAPWTDELRIVAMVLLAVAWLALVLGLRWQLRTKAVAILPGLATFAGALTAAGSDRENLPPMWLLLSIEVTAAVALVAISAWQPETRGRHIRRLAVVLWGTTAFGAIHMIAEYVAMIIVSERDWDTPPGTGYLTAAVITISAALSAIMTLRGPRIVADKAQHHSDLSRGLVA